MIRIIQYIFYFLDAMIPRLFTLSIMRLIYQSSDFGKRYVNLFDPNTLRKNLNYKRNKKPVLISGREGWKLFVDVNDHIGFQMFMTDRPFETSLLKLVDLVGVEDANTVLDIGANIGSASIPVCIKNQLNLIAIEASKENSIELLRNLSVNTIQAQVHIFALVDSGNVNFIKLFKPVGNSGANSIERNWNSSLITNSTEEWVPTTTLDRLNTLLELDRNKISFIKIDVEGSELQVLRGGREFFAGNRAPILFEYRSDIQKKFLAKGLDGIAEFLKSLNYEFFVIDRGRITSEIFDPVGSYENILAVKADSEAILRIRELTEGGVVNG